MKRASTILFFLLYALLIHSQEIAKHNMYHYSTNYINPAATACGSCKTFNISDKHQWSGIKGAPSIQALSVQMPKHVHKTKKHGLGLNMVRDNNGATQHLSGELIYSFHVMFGKYRENFLSFGLSGNFGQSSFDERDFTADIDDPIITRGIETEINYNAASGIYLYSKNYWAGVGVYNMLPVNTTLYQEYGNEQFFLTAIAGYNIKPRSNNFILKTSVYACKGDKLIQFDLNNHFYLKNKVWTGITLRKYIGSFFNSGQNALLFLGYEMEKWDVSYAYDLGLNKLQHKHYGSHQLSIGYRICQEKYACPTY